MTAVHLYPWLAWPWILACIARIQKGNASGVLEVLEGICQSNIFTMDEVSDHQTIIIHSYDHDSCI